MSSHSITESLVEEAALAWLQEVGYTLAWGPDLAPDGLAPERSDYDVVILAGRLHAALLPKLLPSEVCVVDVEGFVEMATR